MAGVASNRLSLCHISPLYLYLPADDFAGMPAFQAQLRASLNRQWKKSIAAEETPTAEAGGGMAHRKTKSLSMSLLTIRPHFTGSLLHPLHPILAVYTGSQLSLVEVRFIAKVSLPSSQTLLATPTDIVLTASDRPSLAPQEMVACQFLTKLALGGCKLSCEAAELIAASIPNHSRFVHHLPPLPPVYLIILLCVISAHCNAPICPH